MSIGCLRWGKDKCWPTSSASGVVPVVRLTEVFRQLAESRIIVNAHRINQGMMPDIASADVGDFYFVDAVDAAQGVRKLLAIVRERIPKRFRLDPIRDIQVLCPMNRGGLGARSLNIELQNALNPPGEIRIDRFGWTFWPGDKVMQVENDYDKEVYNGTSAPYRASIWRKASSWSTLMATKLPTALVRSMSSCSPTRRQPTRAKARNIRLWLSH